MIVIDRLKSPKQGISSMFVLNTEGKQRVDSKLLNDQELEYINREYSDNNRTFFAFDKLSHWEIVAVVENKDAEYKTIGRKGVGLLRQRVHKTTATDNFNTQKPCHGLY